MIETAVTIGTAATTGAATPGSGVCETRRRILLIASAKLSHHVVNGLVKGERELKQDELRSKEEPFGLYGSAVSRVRPYGFGQDNNGAHLQLRRILRSTE